MTGAAATRRHRFPTAILLTCVAIGVAGGVLLAPANWLSTVLVAVGSPVASMAIVGFWLLPAVVALRLLRRPGVGILVGVISGLVIVPFSGYGFMSIISNGSWALLAELPFLVTLWKFWPTWMHYVGALATGVIYPLTAWQFFDMGRTTLVAQVLFFVVTLASAAAAAALGILIADRLRRAGVGGRV